VTGKDNYKNNNLRVYDKLREAHSIIKETFNLTMSQEKENAIEAVNSVLYMAEGIFCKDEQLTS
jgi:hypothetical protein